MAVHRHDTHLRGVAGGLHAGNVAVVVERQLQGARLVTPDVVAEHFHLRVLLARHWILIGIESRIVAILLALRSQALEELHGVLFDLTLVEAHPHQLLGVGGERHGRVVGELLLVHPVGDAVDDLIELAVLRHLALGVVVEQLDEENIVVADEGDDVAVGREHRRLLGTALGERLQLVVLDSIYIIGGSERAAVDALRLRLDEQALAVGAHDVALHVADLGTACRRSIEEHAHLFACLERVGHDALAVVADLCVSIASCQRRHGRHHFLTELATGNVPQLQFLTCYRLQHAQEHHRPHNHLSFHVFL